MITPLEPTPELLACARRVATRDWVVAEDEVIDMDAPIGALVTAGYAVIYYPPTRLRPDYWTLTTSGREWLAQHDTKESK